LQKDIKARGSRSRQSGAPVQSRQAQKPHFASPKLNKIFILFNFW